MSLVMIDPGHFHAILVQSRMYDGIDPLLRVYAPACPELETHLKYIEEYNTRKENPTAWKMQVYTGEDYLKRFSSAAKAGECGEKPIVVLAGKNNRKGDYALAAVEAGCSVLADKPMGITPEVFAKTEQAARLAQRKGLCFADIMTARYDMRRILQRKLAADRDFYGEQDKGTPEDPAVIESSIHYFYGHRRPEWYYDTKVQGEGITDVSTHLVDLVQWLTFPEVRLNKDDVEMLTARSWPTVISPEEFKLSTLGTIEKPIKCLANGEFVWRLRGVHCQVSVFWNYRAKAGDDGNRSLMRGTKAALEIREDAKTGQPALYVRSRGEAAATEAALKTALVKIGGEYPDVGFEPTDEAGVWRIVYPKRYDEIYRNPFGMVVDEFLGWMKTGKEDPLYIDNMLVKYYTIVEAWKKSKK